MDHDAVQELLDRQRIADVLAVYCERLDEYDIDAVALTFTDDVVTDYGPGRGGLVGGRDAVRARIAAGQSVFRRTSHQLGQSRVTFDTDMSGAAGVTYVTAWHERHDGSRDTARLRYVDRFRRMPDGSWLIAERRVEALGIEGFEGVEWVWVPRRSPASPMSG